jgi:aminoglycoside phosphotransferase (APT) family kinase protein
MMKTVDIRRAFLAHRKALGIADTDKVNIKPLGAGENNLNFLATAGRRKFVVRVGLKKGLERNFRREFRFLKRVPAGLAPRPLALDTSKRTIPYVFSVLSYTEGKSSSRWTRAQLSAFAQAVAKIHLSTRTEGYGDLGKKKRQSIVKIVEESWWKRDFPEELAEPAIKRCYEGMIRELQANDKVLSSLKSFTLVHGDACVDNILFHDGKAALIDWEWASYDDPAIDLAKCFSLSGEMPPWRLGLSESQVKFLIDEYQKVRKDRTLLKRVLLWNLVSDFGGMLFFRSKVKRYAQETKPHPREHYQKNYERMLAYFTARYQEE